MNLREATVEYLRQLRASGVRDLHLPRETIQHLKQIPTNLARVAEPVSAPTPTFDSMPRKTSKPAVQEASHIEPISSSAMPVEVSDKKLTTAEKIEKIEELKKIVLPCTKCPHLVASRNTVVFGVGNPDADIFFVGEAPGADEDLAGEPFVGKAGQLLTKMIEAMELKREDVFIANILKCRPDTPGATAGNRKPTTKEIATCKPYIINQIRIVRPKVLVALGATAVEGLLQMEKTTMRDLRGKFHEYENTPLMVTYHPAYLLRNQSIEEKRKVWEDLLMVMEKVGLPISDKQRNYFLKK
jgi:DNA polymerase